MDFMDSPCPRSPYGLHGLHGLHGLQKLQAKNQYKNTDLRNALHALHAQTQCKNYINTTYYLQIMEKVSFYSRCYGCNTKKEVVACISWGGQNGSDGKWVRGSWRNFCLDCAKKYNIKIDRLYTVDSILTIPKHSEDFQYSRCSKCNRYFPRSKFFQTTCSICYGKKKDKNIPIPTF